MHSFFEDSLVNVRHGAAWLSWLTVATGIYAWAWSISGDGFPVFPESAYLWLSDRLDLHGVESWMNLVIWSTSAVAVLSLHAVGLLIYRLAIAVWGAAARRWIRQASTAFRYIGWISWMIVATLMLAFCLDTFWPSGSLRFASHVGSLATLGLLGLVTAALHAICWVMIRRKPARD